MCNITVELQFQNLFNNILIIALILQTGTEIYLNAKEKISAYTKII